MWALGELYPLETMLKISGKSLMNKDMPPIERWPLIRSVGGYLLGATVGLLIMLATSWEREGELTMVPAFIIYERDTELHK